jgi:sugar phosphate isomerase/epimerase
MRLGCCAPLDRAGAVAAAGYEYWEPPVVTVAARQGEDAFAAVRERFAALSLAPEAWNCLLPGELKVTGPDADLDSLARYLEIAFARIAEVGGRVVVFGSGRARAVPEGFDRAQAEEQVAAFLRLAGDAAAERDLTLALEPLNRGECNIINSVAEGLAMVRRVAHERVRLLADCYHMWLEDEPMSNLIEAGDALAHIHVSDRPRRAPAPGADELNPFLSTLRAAGYDGRISVECRWGDDFEGEARRARDFLLRLWAEVG